MYITIYKEILDTNSININRAFSTEDIPHSLLDICKIDYALKDSTRSIFNSNFVERERFVKEENYDDIRSKALNFKSKYSPQTCRETYFCAVHGEIAGPYSAAKHTFIQFTAK